MSVAPYRALLQTHISTPSRRSHVSSISRPCTGEANNDLGQRIFCIEHWCQKVEVLKCEVAMDVTALSIESARLRFLFPLPVHSAARCNTRKDHHHFTVKRIPMAWIEVPKQVEKPTTAQHCSLTGCWALGHRLGCSSQEQKQDTRQNRPSHPAYYCLGLATQQRSRKVPSKTRRSKQAEAVGFLTYSKHWKRETTASCSFAIMSSNMLRRLRVQRKVNQGTRSSADW
jgi:hypothetical protein